PPELPPLPLLPLLPLPESGTLKEVSWVLPPQAPTMAVIARTDSAETLAFPRRRMALNASSRTPHARPKSVSLRDRKQPGVCDSAPSESKRRAPRAPPADPRFPAPPGLLRRGALPARPGGSGLPGHGGDGADRHRPGGVL